MWVAFTQRKTHCTQRVRSWEQLLFLPGYNFWFVISYSIEPSGEPLVANLWTLSPPPKAEFSIRSHLLPRRPDLKVKHSARYAKYAGIELSVDSSAIRPDVHDEKTMILASSFSRRVPFLTGCFPKVGHFSPNETLHQLKKWNST